MLPLIALLGSIQTLGGSRYSSFTDSSKHETRGHQFGGKCLIQFLNELSNQRSILKFFKKEDLLKKKVLFFHEITPLQRGHGGNSSNIRPTQSPMALLTCQPGSHGVKFPTMQSSLFVKVLTTFFCIGKENCKMQEFNAVYLCSVCFCDCILHWKRESCSQQSIYCSAVYSNHHTLLIE